MSSYAKDLVVLVADKAMEQSVKALLTRPHEMGVRPIINDVFRHDHQDSGCFNDCHGHLQKKGWCRPYGHALVMLDKAFDKQKKYQKHSAEELESIMESRLSGSGWDDRAAAIMIDPELEAWVWSDSPELDRCLGWDGQNPDLRSWLRQKGLLVEGSAKPADPKAAMLAALKKVGLPPSASIFKNLAKESTSGVARIVRS